MASLNMGKYHKFDEETLNLVLNDWGFGNYALGHIDDNGFFLVCYVGRTIEQSLKVRLGQHIGEDNARYTHFKFSYAETPLDAYLKECENYHDFGENRRLDNERHPQKLKNDDTLCPVCEE